MARVCVIGAGISGLVTAKTLKAKGHDVVVVEKRKNLGGVWDPDVSYPEVGTQTNGAQYSFSDFPMPADYPEWPDGKRVFSYLNDYAKQFGVSSDILYGAEVTALRYDEVARKWTATIDAAGDQQDATFDKVAICTGIFNRPNVPEFPGAEDFTANGGQILHTSTATDPTAFEGKRVVVVGFQKSATDVAQFSAQHADTTSLVYRRALWKTPKFIAGLINVKYLFYSRGVEALFEPMSPGGGERVLHTLARPAIWGFWRLVENLLKVQLKLPACNLVPEHPIESQISCALSVAPDGYYDAIRAGRISTHKSTIARFESDAVVLADGTKLPADVVVFGTGWLPSLPFFDEDTLGKIIDPDGYFRLYRNIISPDLPDLGFVGYNSSLFCQLTSEVAAAWLGQLWEEQISLPSTSEMKDQVDQRIRWLAEKRPSDLRSFRNSCVAPFEYHYWDELLTDMGLRTRRTRNWLVETFKPLNPKDYHELLRPIRPLETTEGTTVINA